MSQEISTPKAARLARPSWRDSRLLVGVFLLLASTAIGAYVISRADERIPMYAAQSDLGPGRAITTEDVVSVDVQLGAQDSDYVSAGDPLPQDAVILREVRAGELIPRSALGTAAQAGVQAVTLNVDATSAAQLRAGSVVDLYVNRIAQPQNGPGGSPGAAPLQGPIKSLGSLSVSGLARADRALGGVGGTRAVRLMIPLASVPQIVADVDSGAKITLIPVPGSLLENDS